MQTIRTPIASDFLATLKARLDLPLLENSSTCIVLETSGDVRAFSEAAAYWSQPHSVGDQRWSSENQRMLETLLTSMLAQFLARPGMQVSLRGTA